MPLYRTEPMITNYKRARRDAMFLTEWYKQHPRGISAVRYLEALQVMNGHDAINLFAVVMMTEGVLPDLPNYDSADIPDTGA